uniref:Bifunctional inhibitor/plant lipid transfer protein/seed storage helical domain-containing protein n=1 Tax=Tanacetum cinerariifolium TaxID=118510 RepID=A0A699TP79_TANCI|nr:bifunctional inhibitor/plant lipid transfer protein/seed storage helical domain-containing protein [Tanacetum cinerariifolium]
MKCWSLVIVLMVMMLLAMASAGPNARQCKKERSLALNACKSVMYGRLPSASCCQRVRVTHAKCICPVITAKLVALVNVDLLTKLITGCGRKVPRRFKCGSLTTP